MPTRLRVDLAGYHHIINRGGNRCIVGNHSKKRGQALNVN